MSQKHLRFGKGFSVALTNARAQAATMMLEPGDTEGGPDNRHRGSDQWLFVLSGRGVAVTGGRRRQLRTGSLLLIERGTAHEIRNPGRSPLRTLNWYVPPAYTRGGNPLPRGRSWLAPPRVVRHATRRCRVADLWCGGWILCGARDLIASTSATSIRGIAHLAGVVADSKQTAG